MSTGSTLVSVVIPSYNYAHFLGNALRSALEQSYAPVEVVVVDDGSTDDTADVVMSFGDAVTYIRQSNSGLSAARNRGIARATGNMIQLLDADDELTPTQLETLMFSVEAHPSADIFIGSWDEIDLTGRVTAHVEAVQPDEDYFHSLFDPITVGPPCRYLVRKDALVSAGAFSSRFGACEDWDMWLRLAHRGATPVAVEAACSRYRNHAGSLSKNYLLMWRSGLNVLSEAAERDGRCVRCRHALCFGRRRWREWCFHSMLVPELRSYRRDRRWDLMAGQTATALAADPGLFALLVESGVRSVLSDRQT